MPQVVKSDGSRADSTSAKIAPASSARCTSDRCPPSYVDEAINRIVQQVLARGEREVASRAISARW